MNNFYEIAGEEYDENQDSSNDSKSDGSNRILGVFGSIIDQPEEESVPSFVDGVELKPMDKLYFEPDTTEINNSAQLSELPYIHLGNVN